MLQIIEEQTDRFIPAVLCDLQKILGDHRSDKGDDNDRINIEDNGQQLGDKRRHDHISEADGGTGNKAVPQ